MTENAIDVCVIYQDWDLAERALRACARLGHRLGGELNLQSDAWNGNALESYDDQRRVLEHALQTDVIIVAIPADEEPAEGLKAVLNRWAELRPARDGALIGFFSNSCPGVASRFLSSIARRARCDFIVPSEVRRGARSVDRCCAHPAGMMYRWGINE